VSEDAEIIPMRPETHHRSQTAAERVWAASVDYLTRLPETVPPDRWLVHNHVRPTRWLGSRGFRAWLEPPGSERLEVCDCDWAPELGVHYRVSREPKGTPPFRD
jgi:hypothetical protein